MKTSIITALLLLLGLNCAASPATQLIRRMAKLQKYGVMTGHQDDPIYGHNWNLEKGRSDVKEVCGDYPAVMGFELGDLELGKTKISTVYLSTVCARKSKHRTAAAASWRSAGTPTTRSPARTLGIPKAGRSEKSCPVASYARSLPSA